MNQKLTLESLKSNLKREDRRASPGTYYPFWLMNEDEHVVVRFLPDLNTKNPLGFLVMNQFHTLIINGKVKSVQCLSMYGDDCPVCKASRDFYSAGDQENGKKYWRKKQYFAQAIIVKDPSPPNPETKENFEGKIAILTLGYQIYDKIKEQFTSTIEPLECLPFDFTGGYDFVIKKTMKGKYPNYGTGTKFLSKPRPLTDDELAVAEEGMIDLSTCLPPNPGIQKVQDILNANLCGTGYVDEDGGDDDEPFVPVVTKTKPPEDSAENVDDVIAAVKARRAARQAQA
jgi:hypothetical protein